MNVDMVKTEILPSVREKITILAGVRWVWKPVSLFLISRFVVFLVAYLSSILLIDAQSPPPYHLRSQDNVLVDVFGSRWDTGFYVSIAEEGYIYDNVPLPSVPFFPLLPLLMRSLAPLTGDALIAGLWVSNLALLIAVIFFYRLVQDRWGDSVAERSVWYLLIFPTAFFGSAVYTESLFLLWAIGSLYFARKGYWELAALFGFAATLTRLVGLIVVPMLLAEWLVQRWTDGETRPSYLALLAPAAAPLGTGAYMAFLWQKFGDPLAFITGAQAWERVPRAPWLMIEDLMQTPAGGWWSAALAGRVHVDNLTDFGLVILFFLLAVVLLLNRYWAEGVFVLAGVLVPLSSGLLMSQRRYVWVLFPAFILLARWGDHPWVDRLITGISLVGLALFTALFANGYWVG